MIFFLGEFFSVTVFLPLTPDVTIYLSSGLPVLDPLEWWIDVLALSRGSSLLFQAIAFSRKGSLLDRSTDWLNIERRKYLFLIFFGKRV
jgi:hypothetical protein